MIPAHKTVIRIDIDQDIFNKFMASDCSFSPESWDIVEDGRKSLASWDGDLNYQILKAGYDEAEIEAKSANIKRKIKLNELRDYERSIIKPKKDE